MILGDLIVTDIGSWKINKRLKSEVRVRSISGTTKKECPQHKDCLIPSEPDKIVFHHGTNYLVIQLSPDDITNNIIALATSTKVSTQKVSVSGIPRKMINGTTKEDNTDLFLLSENKLDENFRNKQFETQGWKNKDRNKHTVGVMLSVSKNISSSVLDIDSSFDDLETILLELTSLNNRKWLCVDL